MKKKRVIIFTGGGSGGHLVPALTLIEELKREEEWDIYFIGPRRGMEREWVEEKGVPFHGVFTGKLRRYWSVENFLDIFRFPLGVVQALFFIGKFSRKATIFSMGGFAGLPAVFAGFLLRWKIYLHEQTTLAGLANRVGAKLADKVFISFPSSKRFFPPHKTILSGYPLPEECFDRQIRHKNLYGIDLTSPPRPILFVTGGGNGSRLLNEKIRSFLQGPLGRKFLIIHQVGEAFLQEYAPHKSEFYLPLGIIKEGMADLFKVAHIVISRAGAGTVAMLLALSKRSILVPLKMATKNEQMHNAMEAKERLNSQIVGEEDFLQGDLEGIISTFEEGEGLTPVENRDDAKEIIIGELKKR